MGDPVELDAAGIPPNENVGAGEAEPEPGAGAGAPNRLGAWGADAASVDFFGASFWGVAPNAGEGLADVPKLNVGAGFASGLAADMPNEKEGAAGLSSCLSED